MIHIEKLSLKTVQSISWQSFVDIFSGKLDYPADFLDKTPWAKINKKIEQYILPKIESKLSDIKIGHHYSTRGIDIDQLLLSPPSIENLVIEISIGDLSAIPSKKLKQLFENYIILLNDFSEFSTTYGIQHPHIIHFLTERNIKPKKLCLVGAPFQMKKEYEPLNISVIPFEYWLVATLLMEESFFNVAIDNQLKERLIGSLYNNEPKEFCAIPMLKPRRHRIELLAELDQHNLLDKCDWSLGLNFSKRLDNFIENVDPLLSDNAKHFKSKYKFPKKLDFNEDWTLQEKPQSAIPTLPSFSWFNRFKFIVCSETYVGNEIDPIMGGCATVTEKTFKSFLYGSVPIIHGGKGSVEHIMSLGFEAQIPVYDESNIYKISDILLHLAVNSSRDTDKIVHNFNRITDLNFMSELVAQPLLNIADLINSIRR